jgi:hypothetical protein
VQPVRQPYEVQREEIHVDLLARNVFRVTVIGFFGFLAATFYVMAH